MSYNLNRFTLSPTTENLGKADFIWINQGFKLDRHSILDEQTLKSMQSKNYKLVYSNKKTGASIYNIR